MSCLSPLEAFVLCIDILSLSQDYHGGSRCEEMQEFRKLRCTHRTVCWRSGHYFVHTTLCAFLWGGIYSLEVTHFIFLKSIEYSPGLIVSSSSQLHFPSEGCWAEADGKLLQVQYWATELRMRECRQETKTPNSLDGQSHKSKGFQVTFTAPLREKQASHFSLSYISLPFCMSHPVCE